MTEAFVEAKWQIVVLVAVFGLCVYCLKQWPSRHAVLAILCYTASVILFNVWVFTDDLDYAFKLFNAGINGALVVYLGALIYFLYRPAALDDLAARLLWGCVGIAELWGLVFNNIGCNLVLETESRAEVAETWGTEASKYVCGREVGEWFEFTPLIVEMAFMWWIVDHWARARRMVNE